MKSASALSIALAVALVACAGPEVATEHCDAEGLQSALAAAQPGDVVQLGSCTIEGDFRVPTGVSLVGDESGGSILRGAGAGAAVLRLEAGDPAARVEGVRVETSAAAGVYATGLGAVTIEDVEIVAREGVGALFVDVGTVTLTRVTITGPVPAPDGADHTDSVFTNVAQAAPERVEALSDTECGLVVPRACMSDERREAACPGCGAVRQYCDGCGEWVSVMATQGLTFIGVGDATLSDVDVRGFAAFGVVARGTGSSTLSWMRGAITGNMGTGLYADGVAMVLEDVDIDDTYAGFRSAPAVAGFIIGDSAHGSLVTRSLGVSASRGYGLIHLGATSGVSAEHDGLSATGNGLAALWVSESESFQLTNAMVADNRLAGLVVVSTSGVVLRDTVIRGTQTRTVQVGSGSRLASVTLGDGIQLFDATRAIEMQRVTFDGNERVGLSLDLGAGGTADADLCGAARDGVCFDAVTVRGSGTERGAIAGNMPMMVEADVFTVQPVGDGRWDQGITREGSAVDDALFTEPLQVTGVVAPLDYPVTGVVAPLD